MNLRSNKTLLNKANICVIIFILVAVSSIPGGTGLSFEEDLYAAPELPLNDGKRWRVGYVEGEPFTNFAGHFYFILQGLETIGWVENIDKLPYKQGQEDSYAMWQWLVESDTGLFIEFVPDAHYILSDPEVNKEDIVERLNEDNDLDLLIVMGTRAGIDMSRDNHNTPIMVFSTSNAVQAGIINSEHDSGRGNVWAHMDSERYKRHIEVFHDIFEFNKLGLVYEDSDIGRIFAAVSDVEEVADSLGFQVISEHVDELDINNPVDRERYYSEIMAANQRLAETVDAMYITIGDWDLADLPMLLEPFYENNIPVFSQMGTREVKHGALLSVHRRDFSGVGRFGAEAIDSVFKGVSPRSLSQIYGDTPMIAINLKVAEKIGYQVPFEVLLVSDEIFN